MAPIAGRVRAQLRRKGRRIGDLDSLIAAHARVRGLILVTHHGPEFTRVPDLEVEDWV